MAKSKGKKDFRQFCSRRFKNEDGRTKMKKKKKKDENI